MGYFVPHDKISNLKYYKYQSEDLSIVSKHLLKPFWLRFCTIFPKWMAPNVITLSGLGFIMANVLITIYYDPNLTEETPRWTYISYALGMFMYQTFDGCDGIHARQTGQSGPLGELFDHSIDALNTTLSLFLFISASSVGYTNKFLFCQFCCLLNFYLSTWEEYHTHVLFLSEISGPVEGILMIASSLFLTGIFGPDIMWHTALLTFDNNLIHYDLTFLDIFLFSLFVGVIFNVRSSIANVRRYYKDKYVSNNGTDEATKEATKGLIPFFAYFASIYLLILNYTDFVSFPFIISIGLTGAFMVGRIIVAHLTKQEFPMIHFPMFMPTIQLLLTATFVDILGYDIEPVRFALVWLGCGLTLGIHGLFFNEIIYEFTSYLDVYALSIKYPKLKY
ncbi:Choline/ethanolaminephosphotransferase 1 [Nakaseomyces bracarensis]|uniref:Choline/ethanolaminephosphotransferase 1 n=1 Tax=Nakaseomyces bracarensis TaxID=273131 RepID=A0ABR4NQI4_9SACH